MERYRHVPQNKYPVWCLKTSGDKLSSGVSVKSEKKFGLKEEHTIICRNCGNTITTSDSIVSVNGNHRHTFINPAGMTFQIVCFSSADGCIVYGDPTLEHTWFEGFIWNYCICSRCHIHLGWFYRNDDDTFFGLILDLLQDITKTH